MTNKKNKKHFLIFYSYNALAKISPRKWARYNQQLFPQYGFTCNEDHPTTNQIINFIVANYDFKRVENNEIVIHYNFSKSLKF
ncbi:MAG TPA: hypothetical protein DHV22_11255 [Xanthomarina gelatinilytica]|uniref:Uncharacterized protein n=1 Tax=Xanthomarina gelatinilytica TaxID=1137281 RepID=A0A3D6BT59_9FLAO|nr:hypothetical protein [Xanthomarina gelatinilytica]